MNVCCFEPYKHECSRGYDLKYIRTALSLVPFVCAIAAASFLKRGHLETMGFLFLVYFDFLKLGAKYCACYPFCVNANSAILSIQPRFVAMHQYSF